MLSKRLLSLITMFFLATCHLSLVQAMPRKGQGSRPTARIQRPLTKFQKKMQKKIEKNAAKRSTKK
jgi:hypothetical protein